MKCTEHAERNLPTLQSNIDSMYALLVHEFKQNDLMVKHYMYLFVTVVAVVSQSLVWSIQMTRSRRGKGMNFHN